MNVSSRLHVHADRREKRRDRRYLTPPLELEIGGRRLTAIDWSLGGFLVRADLALARGATVHGTLRLPGSDGFSFIARLVRKDPETEGLGFEFTELTPLALARWSGAAVRALGRTR